MKTLVITILSVLLAFGAVAQKRNLQFFRPNDQKGLNVFETSKDNDTEFDGVKVHIGGDFALQFQGISHEGATAETLVDLGNNFNLPTANLNMDVQLDDGLRLHVRTYLSSRHHAEAWIKGGYIQIDKLDFISEGLLSGLMDIGTIKVGMDQYNYGDAQFRRSDNAMAIFNPFVGNYIMDAFSTEPFVELTLQPSDFLIVLGATNGRLNQNPANGDDGMVFFSKLGFDKQINDGLRTRLTASLYTSSEGGTRDYLYGGDRAGGRYYRTMETDASGSDFDPRYNPRYAYQTAFQINPFVKAGGFEFFGIFESVSNGDDTAGGGFTQLGAEALYRLGSREQFYLGFRYNDVKGELNDGDPERQITRTNFGGGWYLTENMLLKLDVVSNTYSGDALIGTNLEDGKFNGFVLEAVLGF